MKFFKKKNLLNVLYAVLIALPLFSILGRVLYTQWNQNAKDSYSGTNIQWQQILIEERETDNILEVGKYYLMDGTTFNTLLSENQSQDINYINFELIQGYISSDEETILQTSTKNRIYFEWYPIGELTYTKVYYFEDNYIQYEDLFDLEIYGYVKILDLTFVTDLASYNTGNTFETILQSQYDEYFDKYIYEYQEIEISTLDNSFDYSISQFVSENDFGKLNFFTWFTDLFLSNNSVNNLYIHFINWYLNYTLYVSLGYILWLVLMWFVSFIRRLLEKTSTYETGGF